MVLQVGARFAGGTNLARRDRGKWGVAYDRTQHCRVPLWVRIGRAGTKKIPRGAGSRGCLLFSSSSEVKSGKTETVRSALANANRTYPPARPAMRGAPRMGLPARAPFPHPTHPKKFTCRLQPIANAAILPRRLICHGASPPTAPHPREISLPIPPPPFPRSLFQMSSHAAMTTTFSAPAVPTGS